MFTVSKEGTFVVLYLLNTYTQRTSILTTCVYFTECHGTLKLYVHMTTCFSSTRYSNITKVPSLLTVQTPTYHLDILQYFDFKNLYNCFYAHPVNIWDPILYSAHCYYLLQINVGMRMV